MRTRVKTTPRTWVLILIAVIASGVITWLQHREREATPREPEPREVEQTAPESHEVEIELVE